MTAGAPRPTAGRPERAVAVVLGPRGTVLVIRRIKDGRRYAVLPGGGVEAGERPAQAALRELAEETGVPGRLVRSLGAMQHGDRRAHYFLVEVEASVPLVLGGPERAKASPSNSYAPSWISADDLDVENLQPVVVRSLVATVVDR